MALLEYVPLPNVIGSSVDRGGAVLKFNWVTPLSAATYAGKNAVVTFADGKQRVMFSDGVKWFPEAALFNLIPNASVTGSTAKTLLQTITVPANLLAVNGSLVLDLQFSHTGTAGTKTVTVEANGIAVFSHVAATSGLASLTRKTLTRNTTGSLISTIPGPDQGITSTTTPAAVAVNFSADWDIKIYTQLSAAADASTLLSATLAVV